MHWSNFRFGQRHLYTSRRYFCRTGRSCWAVWRQKMNWEERPGQNWAPAKYILFLKRYTCNKILPGAIKTGPSTADWVSYCTLLQRNLPFETLFAGRRAPLIRFGIKLRIPVRLKDISKTCFVLLSPFPYSNKAIPFWYKPAHHCAGTLHQQREESDSCHAGSAKTNS